jgi:serine/threonine-protein kinase
MSQPAVGTDVIPVAGEVLAGKYRIDRELGRGGMGVVLAAHHLHLDEAVAIKFLLPELSQDANLVARFLREGRASIKIRSEHVVRVLDVATMPGGSPYMVMEYLDGTDLEGLIERTGPLPVRTAVAYVLQAIEAIAEAHSLGLVHRDLKPANLFLVHRRDGSECVKVLDFGITKVVSPDAGSNLGLTSTQSLMGSPRYMSPEQMRPTRPIDARSDVWALGVVLYELLAGVPPFTAQTMTELLASILQDSPPPLTGLRPEVPLELERTIRRCLEKDPAGRPENVAELARALVPYGPPEAGASADRASRVLKVSPPSRPSLPDAAPGPRTSSPRLARTEAATLGAATGSAWGNVEEPQGKSRRALFLAGGIGAFALVAGSIVVAMSLQHTREQPATLAGTAAAAASTVPFVAASDGLAVDLPPVATQDQSAGASAMIDAGAPDPKAAPIASSRSRVRGPAAAAPSVQSSNASAKGGSNLFEGRK